SGRVMASVQPSQWAGVPLQGELKAQRDANGNAQASGRFDAGSNRIDFSASDSGPASARVEANAELPALAALAPWWGSASSDAATAWMPRAGTLQAHAEAH